MQMRLEKYFWKWGAIVFQNPIKILLFTLLILIYPIIKSPEIKIDTSTEGFMHKNDPTVLLYNQFLSQFGKDGKIIIFIKNDNIFSVEFLTLLKQFHMEIENNVPYLNKVLSLYNVRNTRGEDNKLITDNLLTPFPKSQDDANLVKEKVVNSTLYQDYLLTKDLKGTVLILQLDAYSHTNKKLDANNYLEDGFNEEIKNNKFLTDKEASEAVKSSMKLIEKYKSEGYEIYMAGAPVIMDGLKIQMGSDMRKFTGITILVIVISLYLMFKRISVVIYILITILISVFVTIGTMVIFDVPLKLPTQVIPTLLLAVSVAANVHLLSIFFDKFNETKNKKQSIQYTFEHSGLAIVMTSLTTALGLGSFIFSEVAPVSDLGIYATLGVIISLLLTFTLLPALLIITKLKPKQVSKKDRIDIFMKNLAIISIKYYKSIIVISILVFFFTLYFLLKLSFSHNPLLWFSEDNKTRIATQIVDSNMNGTVSIEAIIDTKIENGWQDPERLKKLEDFIKDIQFFEDNDIKIGKVNSIATIIKETNQALHSNDKQFYTIPDDKKLIAQELLLFENSGRNDLKDFIDNQYSKARISMTLPWVDAVKVSKLLEHVEVKLNKYFGEDDIKITGVIPIMVSTFNNSKSSSLESYAMAFFTITLMMILILGSIKVGLISMIPNITPIVFGFLIMYLLNIPLDMFTLIVASIVLGLVVDDTIHFMVNFKRYYFLTKDSSEAIKNTFHTAGKAMVITTVVLALGFFSYAQGDMVSIQNFGILTSSIIVLALIADLFLAPALMIVISKKGWLK